MSLFGSLGNILGKATGVKIQPFKGKVSVTTPLKDLNTGDLLTGLSLLAPGMDLTKIKSFADLGLGNLSNTFGSLSLSSLQKNPVLSGILLSSLGGLTGKPAPAPTQTGAGLNTSIGGALGNYSKLLDLLMPGAMQEAARLPQVSANRATIADRAAAELTPGSMQAGLDMQRSKMLSDAMRGVRAQELALGPAAKGLNSGLTLSAYNRANSAANQAEQQAYSPTNMAAINAARLSLADPSNYTTTLNTSMGGLNNLIALLNNQRSADAVYRQTAPPTFLESILPLLGTAAGNIDWSKVFK